MDYSNIKTKLDGVGCGFCLAKWSQVTIHLDKGLTHSCHHPSPHKIPLRELRNNPSALHNTRFKKKKRREMLNGKRPKECDFCWNVEDNSNSFSDRTLKSAEPWAWDQFEKIKSSNWNENYNPRYVEVSFSNACNFACAYCGPQYSSKWVEEIEKHGGYPTEHSFNSIDEIKARDQMPYKQSEHNPYVEAFWKWWPDLYPDLHTFRMTGGEPLMSKDVWKVLEYIRDNPDINPNLSLSINTNLGVPDKLIDKLLDIVEDLTQNNKVREFIIFTSCEATGRQAEYSRFGLDYDKFWFNIEKILKRLPKVTVNIMAAFNALSVFTYSDLIDKVYEFKKKYHNDQRYWVESLQLDTSYLRWPTHLSVKILEPEHKELILEAAKKALYYGMKDTPMTTHGFSDIQIQKIKRTYDYAVGESDFDVEKYRKDFVKFVTEYDRRRNTNFLEVFPELKDMYVKYKK
jgi:organic radical activating enzyme